MRLPLLAAALAAAAATAAPAEAMFFPVCATHLENAAAGTVSSCNSGNNPVSRAIRILDVDVHTGAVEATLTCFSSWGNETRSGVYAAGQSGQLSLAENADNCHASLRALSAGTTATGLSHFTPRVFTGPTP
ncbi:MAG TPA: hypothetical protein VNQ77_15385 [Frankiaceae bacterium]|nr:hypothetical protein [Frankiaceae bacterium]